jgi:exonuclease III
LKKRKLQIDVIAIQETWEVRYPELVNIEGFQTFVFKNRESTRGGGLGFYVRNGLRFKILEELSPFEDKIFESLTIKLTYPSNKSVLLTCGYRSNGTIPNVTPAQQQNSFIAIFEELLLNLNRKKLDSYILMDANIDLLKLDNNIPSTFLNSCISAGYLQCITKATRFQNEARTLIDHILLSCKHNEISTGTIISDLSDHFFTFVRTPHAALKHAEKTKFVRDFNQENVNRFKALLAASDWSDVTNSQCVNGAYTAFWSNYSDLYEICFPLRKIRFNKNIHTKNPFIK